LETVRHAMVKLSLKCLVARVPFFRHQIKLAREVRIWLVVAVLPHQFPARRTYVGDLELQTRLI